MTYPIPYPAADDAITALGAIVRPPRYSGGVIVDPGGSAVVAAAAGTPTESWDDIRRGQALLAELQLAATQYNDAASRANATLSAQTAAASAYATQLSAYNTSLAALWSFLDRSVRSGTQELIEQGDTSQAWSTAATTPTNNIPVLAARCRTAAEALKKYATCVPMAQALLDGVTDIEAFPSMAPVLHAIADPNPPDTSGLLALVAKANQFTEYLNES